LSGGEEGGGKAWRLYILLGLMVTFWSLNYIIGKVALREFPGLLLSGLRVLIAVAALTPFFLTSRKRRPEGGWNRRELGLLMVLGFIGVGLNQLFFVLGLGRTSVAHASILMGMTPLLVLLLAFLNRLEKLTLRKLAGMGIALVGVAVLNAAPENGSKPTVLGDLLIFLASFTFAIFTVGGKRLTRRYPGITVTAVSYAAGALLLLPLVIHGSASFDYSAVSLGGWAALLYMALFPSALAYLIFYYALTKIAASRVSAFAYLQPLMATVLAAPLLGESLSLLVGLGGGLVLAGVYVTERT
jgi:drug/metabolite transporter (DMT)-like permease